MCIRDRKHVRRPPVSRSRKRISGVISISYSFSAHIREIAELYKQQGFGQLYVLVSNSTSMPGAADSAANLTLNFEQALSPYISSGFCHLIQVQIRGLKSSLDGLRISTNNIVYTHAFSFDDKYIFRGDNDNALMFPRALGDALGAVQHAFDLTAPGAAACSIHVKARDSQHANCTAAGSVLLGERWPFDQVTIGASVQVYTRHCKYASLHRCEVARFPGNKSYLGVEELGKHMPTAPRELLSLQHWASMNRIRNFKSQAAWDRTRGMYARDWFPGVRSELVKLAGSAPLGDLAMAGVVDLRAAAECTCCLLYTSPSPRDS
eukprot:TRINITY_DN48977_c0_g1_i2.p1 TRINITY_DN48977_c0_g1~~TRINITY_DN48977_c0_g1_i2.p1  ORF type:complete len:321 (-),score=64.82 TRINITY_DN48977_c0_g1_i2:98-1060(-)